MVLSPALPRRSISIVFSSTVTGRVSFCRPSRGPTSTILTNLAEVGEEVCKQRRELRLRLKRATMCIRKLGRADSVAILVVSRQGSVGHFKRSFEPREFGSVVVQTGP